MVLLGANAFNEWRYVSIKPHAAHDLEPGNMYSSLGSSLTAFVAMMNICFLFLYISNAVLNTNWWDRHLACLRMTGKMPVPPIGPVPTESSSVSAIILGNFLVHRLCLGMPDLEALPPLSY